MTVTGALRYIVRFSSAHTEPEVLLEDLPAAVSNLVTSSRRLDTCGSTSRSTIKAIVAKGALIEHKLLEVRWQRTVERG